MTTRWMTLLPCLVACLWAPLGAQAHGGTSNELERQVCADASLGDYCEFTDHHERVHRGTCRSFSEVLMCVRNQPFDSQASGTAPNPSHLGADHHGGEAHELVHEHDPSSSPAPITPALPIALGFGIVAVGLFAFRKQGTTQ